MDNNEMNVTEVALDMSEDVNEALEKVIELLCLSQKTMKVLTMIMTKVIKTKIDI